MAYPQVGSITTKLSFAKIAAMPPPSRARVPPVTQKDTKTRSSSQGKPQTEYQTPPSKGATSSPVSQQIPHVTQLHQDGIENITGSIEGLSLVKDRAAGAQESRSAESGDSFEEDRSQFSNSSFNKPHSFDTKSITSVTTFAMDEKESIRPDDSASVRAIEDEDTNLGLSRNSSFQHENDGTLNGGMNGGKNVRQIPTSITTMTRRFTTLTNPPRFGNLPISPVAEASNIDQPQPLLTVSHPGELSQPTLPAIVNTPDEKLLDALSSYKDRLPLLQLEEKLITFLTLGQTDTLELPPQNSFNRLLTHKLADYYGLAHHINEDNSSVRIFKSNTALPMSLTQLAKSLPIGPGQSTSSTTFKIMRRAQLGSRQFSAGNSTTASSSVPSKATSENGQESISDEGFFSPIEGTPSRDKSKPTREEREAQYKAARERIFGDFQESVTSESTSTGENSVSMSRSSSTSGKKKSRKHKQPKDDTFEARSAFIASYAPVNVQYGPAYNDVPYPVNYAGSASTYNQNMYAATPTQNYTGLDQSITFGPTPAYAMGSPSQYSGGEWQNMQQAQHGGYFGFQQQPPYPQQSPVMPPGHSHFMAPNQGISQAHNWVANQYQNAYPLTHPQSNQNMDQWGNYSAQQNPHSSTPSYQYGQLPLQGYGAGNYQHPVPGSYVGSKSLFNPQTRSFVPSNNASRAGGRNGRKKGGGKNPTGPVIPLTPNTTSSSKSGEDTLRQKYGTPANLPKKPPPSQVSLVFDGENVQLSHGQDSSKGGTNGMLAAAGVNHSTA